MLDQVMLIAGDQSTKSYELLDTVSQNIGNYNTTGYKAVRFEQYMRPDGNLDMTKRVDYTPGALFTTKRELDVGLDGPGFIQVTRPDGTTAYTRNGSFAKNAQGYLVTTHGDLVGGGIQIPANYDRLQIHPDGTVQLIDKAGGQPHTVGQLTIVNFTNPEGLKNIGESLVLPTAESGAAQKMDNPSPIRQGMLEQSNVNIHFAVEDILRLNTGVIANLRVVKATDDIYKEAIQLRQ